MKIQPESTYSSSNQIRKQLLKDSIADNVKQKILDIANTRGYEIIAIETDKDHIHFLLSYDTTDRICDIVKIVKQETTYHLWQKYSSVLSKQYWKEKHFGQMVILLVALEKCHQQLYKNMLKVRDNRYDLRGSSHLLAVGFRL